MRVRRVSRHQAETAYTAALAGAPLRPGDEAGVQITAVVLPDRPTPGGIEGMGYLPLTYEYAEEGRRHTLITTVGPDVEEARRFLADSLPDVGQNEPIRLWFEPDEVGP